MQVSIIIPVYNENRINEIIDSIITNETSITYEIIVIDTPEANTINSIENPQVKTFTAPKGRAYQMNAGFKHAQGEFLLFLHADTQLPANALELVVKTLERPSPYDAGAFDIAFDSNNPVMEKIAMLASKRSRFFNIAFGDQAIFVKKEVFENIGGYKHIMLMEDINFMQKLRRKKHKIKLLDEKVITSARRYEEAKHPLLISARNLMLQLLYFCGIDPNSLAKFYK
jgi:rSAM/selenodomain-associated transferase 2